MTDRDLAADELTKLTATWCNTLSAGGLVTGVFAPVFQFAATTSGRAVASSSEWSIIYASVFYLLGGVFMHLLARVLVELRFRS